MDAVAASSVMAAGLAVALTGQGGLPSTTVLHVSLPVESAAVPVGVRQLGMQTLCAGGGRLTVTSVESDLSGSEEEGPVNVSAKATGGKLKSTGLDGGDPKTGGTKSGLKRKMTAVWDQLGWVDDEGVLHNMEENDVGGKYKKTEHDSE
jgi:hypothetical protein